MPAFEAAWVPSNDATLTTASKCSGVPPGRYTAPYWLVPCQTSAPAALTRKLSPSWSNVASGVGVAERRPRRADAELADGEADLARRCGSGRRRSSRRRGRRSSPPPSRSSRPSRAPLSSVADALAVDEELDRGDRRSRRRSPSAVSVLVPGSTAWTSVGDVITRTSGRVVAERPLPIDLPEVHPEVGAAGEDDVRATSSRRRGDGRSVTSGQRVGPPCLRHLRAAEHARRSGVSVAQLDPAAGLRRGDAERRATSMPVRLTGS